MNINSLILTKFKCLFNKNYQKKIPKSELKKKERKQEDGSWKLYPLILKTHV